MPAELATSLLYPELEECSPLINVSLGPTFVLSGRFYSRSWAHCVPRFTSEPWLWSQPVGPNRNAFPLPFWPGGPSGRCGLSAGLAKLTCARSTAAAPVISPGHDVSKRDVHNGSWIKCQRDWQDVLGAVTKSSAWIWFAVHSLPSGPAVVCAQC